MRRLLLAAALLSALLVAPSALAAAPGANTPALPSVAYPGLQHKHYVFGPIHITPGQNSIVLRDDQFLRAAWARLRPAGVAAVAHLLRTDPDEVMGRAVRLGLIPDPGR